MHTRRDMIKNKDIWNKVRITPVEDKLQEVRLKWYGHMRRRCSDLPVRRCERFHMVGLRRGRKRPKKYWREVIRHDISFFELT